ncbi:MAG: MFS transporter [Pseudomonadota bacterium]
MPEHPSSQKLDRRVIVGMFAAGLGIFVVANDFTALSVAIPAIEKSLSVSLSTAQWVINIYAVFFGVVIVTGGKLADMLGRRRLFLIGATIFGVFSFLGGLASEAWMLLACRAVMGVGGALMWPAVLGLTFEIVPEERAGLAGGLVTAVAGLGNAAGPLVGGILTDTLGWEWIFFINVPIALIGMITLLLVIPKDAPTKPDERLDFVGMILLSIGILSLLLALDFGVDIGWRDPRIVGLFVASVVFLFVFFAFERREGERALLPKEVTGNLVFSMSALITLLIAAVFFGAMVYLPQFMTQQLGFSSMYAGIGLAPMMFTYALVSLVAGRVYDAFGPRPTLCLGIVGLAAGMLLLTQISTATIYWHIVPGMFVLGFGIAFFYSAVIPIAVTSLGADRASLASAGIYMVNVAGGALGLGMNTAVVTSAATLSAGIGNAFLVNCGLSLLGLLVALLFIRDVSKPTK